MLPPCMPFHFLPNPPSRCKKRPRGRWKCHQLGQLAPTPEALRVSHNYSATVALLTLMGHTFRPPRIPDFYDAAFEQSRSLYGRPTQRNHRRVVYGRRHGSVMWASRKNDFGRLESLSESLLGWKCKWSSLVVDAFPLVDYIIRTKKTTRWGLRFNCCHTSRVTKTGPFLLPLFFPLFFFMLIAEPLEDTRELVASPFWKPISGQLDCDTRTAACCSFRYIFFFKAAATAQKINQGQLSGS